MTAKSASSAHSAATWPRRALPAFLLLVPITAAAQQLNFRLYDSRDGLPQRQVLALAQDSEGYLWFGTYGGLSRYNGQRIETFTIRDGLTSNVVYDLVEDAAGRLVIGTRGGGVCVYASGSVECFSSSDHVIDADVLDLEAESSGGLWIATSGGVTHWKGRAVRHFALRDGLPSEVCNRVVRDREGQVWVGTLRGLARLSPDGVRFDAAFTAEIGDRPVRALLASRSGLWVGTDDGLFRVRPGGVDRLALPAAFAGAEITDAAEHPDGSLWLTTSRGVLVHVEERFRAVTQRNGLPSDVTRRVLIDREGSVWFGTEAGLSKLAPGPFTIYAVRDGLPHSFVRAFAEDDRGRLWIGTRGGGVAILESDEGRAVLGEASDGARGATSGVARFSTLGPEEGVALQVYALLSAGPDRMLVGTSEGLVLIEGGRSRLYDADDGLPGEGVRSLATDPNGGAWVGTTRGLAHWRDGRIVSYPDQGIVSASPILALETDSRGRLWLGLPNGIAVFDGRAAAYFGPAEGLTDQTIWSIDRDARGRIWIGTNGDGVFRVDPDGEIRQFTKAEGLVDDFVWQVLCDSTGEVWLYTGRGLDRFDGRRFVHYDEGDGLLDLEGSAGAAWRDSLGLLWFGTASGLVRYERGGERRNRVPPPIVLAQATSAAHEGALRPGERLPPGSGPLSFRFSALSFRDESAVRYRYRLLGLSEEWSAPSAQSSVTFGRLGPGHYELQVLGSNDDGLWTLRPARLAFTVAPFLWQTWWFRLIVAVIVVAVVVVGVRLWTRRLDSARRRLEALVLERTLELEEKNALLAEMARIDELTRLHNRRWFLEALELELRRLSREGASSSVSLLMLDLDHFKQVNDRYGHVIGDRLLAAVARRLEATVRTTDLVARYGGEEFAIILRSTPLDGARVIAARICAAIGNRPFDFGELSIRCTASLGVSTAPRLDRVDCSSTARLIAEADGALYRAKAAGRNRLAVHLEGASYPQAAPEAASGIG